ncbi:MAG: DUF2142 domain-containing protein [Actinobacteria bacterium]|uniref:Unannotated protein n=1 Tax=freshwater metagenome TaxID=449393 RepID=A0A6J7SM20_9ZZZZ|nr:DUF2142 domain-containing protein [Actinomycetota bacterium]
MRKLLVSLLVLFGFFIACGTWALASPVGSATDDEYHLPSIWCSWGNSSGICDLSDASSGWRVATVSDALLHRCYVASNLSPTCIASNAGSIGETDFVNGLNRPDLDWKSSALYYGSTFYQTLRMFVNQDVPNSVIRIRIANVTIATFLLTIILVASPIAVARAVALSWFLVLIPLGFFYVASTNPSSWSIIGAGTMWAFLISWLLEPDWRSWRANASLFGLIISCAMLITNRKDGVFDVVVIGLACIILVYRQKMKARIRVWLFGLFLLFISTISTMPSLNYGKELLSGRPSAASIATSPGTNPIVDNVREFLVLPKSLWSVIGGNMRGQPFAPFGLNEIHLSPLVPILLLVALTGFIYMGLRKSTKRKLIAVAFLLSSLAVSTVMQKYLQSPSSFMVQPRHLVPLLLAAAGLIFFSPGPNFQFRAIWIKISLPLAVVGGSVALFETQARYVGDSWRWSTTTTSWWWQFAVGPGWNSVAAFLGLGIMACGVAGLFAIKDTYNHKADSITLGNSAKATH